MNKISSLRPPVKLFHYNDCQFIVTKETIRQMKDMIIVLRTFYSISEIHQRCSYVMYAYRDTGFVLQVETASCVWSRIRISIKATGYS